METGSRDQFVEFVDIARITIRSAREAGILTDVSGQPLMEVLSSVLVEVFNHPEEDGESWQALQQQLYRLTELYDHPTVNSRIDREQTFVDVAAESGDIEFVIR